MQRLNINKLNKNMFSNSYTTMNHRKLFDPALLYT